MISCSSALGTFARPGCSTSMICVVGVGFERLVGGCVSVRVGWSIELVGAVRGLMPNDSPVISPVDPSPCLAAIGRQRPPTAAPTALHTLATHPSLTPLHQSRPPPPHRCHRRSKPPLTSPPHAPSSAAYTPYTVPTQHATRTICRRARRALRMNFRERMVTGPLSAMVPLWFVCESVYVGQSIDRSIGRRRTRGERCASEEEREEGEAAWVGACLPAVRSFVPPHASTAIHEPTGDPRRGESIDRRANGREGQARANREEKPPSHRWRLVPRGWGSPLSSHRAALARSRSSPRPLLGSVGYGRDPAQRSWRVVPRMPVRQLLLLLLRWRAGGAGGGA